ncbi:MAG: GNAT family N-acetyltransferase [Actinomycetes bacterium]
MNGLVSGLLSHGFDVPQTFLTAYNPSWYSAIMTSAGFVTTTTLVAFEFTRDRVPTFGPATTRRVTVRHVDMAAFEDEIGRIHHFQEEVFAGHPGHVNREHGQTRELIERLLPALDPDLVLIAEDAEGNTLGVVICVPDVWQQRPSGTSPSRARLISLGVVNSWRRRGVAKSMGAALTDVLLAKGYDTLEASWVMGGNRPPQLLARALGARVSRRFELYRWEGVG